MTVLMIRYQVTEDGVAEVTDAVKETFAALDAEQPDGLRYADYRHADRREFVALVDLDDGVDNPLRRRTDTPTTRSARLLRPRPLSERRSGWLWRAPGARPGDASAGSTRLMSSKPTPRSRSVRTSRDRATASDPKSRYPASVRPASGRTPASA